MACCDLPIELLGQELQVGVSIGVALFPDDADDIVVLRQRADQAMYRVKQRGKGSVCSAAELPIEPPVSA
ncbi:diguanylate cyclase domain-containing protein [Roseateles sp. DB2]|uniref:diguanylate cyclase domain-containing protein n=1 Tax=Roseateles sp. DB2 TaxID=3453717 RepID=UPI003EEE3627